MPYIEVLHYFKCKLGKENLKGCDAPVWFGCKEGWSARPAPGMQRTWLLLVSAAHPGSGLAPRATGDVTSDGPHFTRKVGLCSAE